MILTSKDLRNEEFERPLARLQSIAEDFVQLHEPIDEIEQIGG